MRNEQLTSMGAEIHESEPSTRRAPLAAEYLLRERARCVCGRLRAGPAPEKADGNSVELGATAASKRCKWYAYEAIELTAALIGSEPPRDKRPQPTSLHM